MNKHQLPKGVCNMFDDSKYEEELLDYFRQLDRSLFIDNENRAYAHIDQPLPIGHGQTISQPSLVLQMTRELKLDKSCRALEIGTGSGYQTAFLARFAGEVFTIERIAELAEKARQRLTDLGFTNIHFLIGDGSEGWPEYAPFDRIMVTAGALTLPAELVEQLSPHGIMVIPVGPEGEQQLVRLTKNHDGQVETVSLGYVRFVEFKGKYGWQPALEEGY